MIPEYRGRGCVELHRSRAANHGAWNCSAVIVVFCICMFVYIYIHLEPLLGQKLLPIMGKGGRAHA